ncbi:uncharacterized protein LOC133190767 [Saccostrea echinata]|uniref:uncharacterized protein LOC133190767 n=1 Tax=Saccostrea echinata TaxID=191078 RepID=UPI002A83F092|nr:uncharacterized protein LOC133190767 [Saccostrea echinata]XP_061182440.1 uncharacterized protein LOC133190767 [Saccostrea echinata]
MADDLGRTPLNKWNLLSGVLLTLFVLGIGVTFLFIGIFEDIEDLVILGSIFLVFTIFVGICVFSTVIRPYIKSGRVEDEDFIRSYSHENVGFSRSDNDLKSTVASFERIQIGNEQDDESIDGHRRAESVIVDVKSRVNSAHSLQRPVETYGKKKRVTFY